MDAVPRKVHRVVVRSVAELASTELTQSPERRDREGGKPIAERERSVAKVYDEAMEETFAETVAQVGHPTKVGVVYVDCSFDFNGDDPSIGAFENQIDFALLGVSEMAYERSGLRR